MPSHLRAPSKILPIPSIHAKPAVLVPRAAHRPFGIELVFNLDRLPLRGSDVRSERHQQIAGHTLLNGNAGSGVLSGACSQSRVDLQL